MSLRRISAIFAVAIASVIVASLLMFREYRRTNDGLVNTMYLLEKFRKSARTIEAGVLTKDIDAASIKETVQNVFVNTRKFQNAVFLVDARPKALIELEISFIRIWRAVEQSLPGYTSQGPLLEQIRNETIKIDESVDGLFELSLQRLTWLRARAEHLLMTLYFLLSAGMFLMLFFLVRMVVLPIRVLTRQVREVGRGEMENVEPPARENRNEINALKTFLHQTIAEIHSQKLAIEHNQRELEQQYQYQLIITRIQELSNRTNTMRELLDEALKIVLSIEWLRTEAKGGIFLVENGDPNHLVLKSWKNFPVSVLQSCGSIPLGECLCGKAAETRQVVFGRDRDPDHDIHYEGMQPHGHYCIPMLFKEELLGVMTFHLPPEKRFREDEVTFLQTISAILAQSIYRRRLAEQHLRISTAIDQAGEGVLILGPDGTIVYANPFVSVMTGYGIEELLGNNLNVLISEEENGFEQPLWTALRQREQWDGVLSGQTKNGVPYDEKVQLTPLREEAGEVSGFVLVKRDITKEKLLESQLVQAQKMEAIGTLAGGIAHDFNNILTSIIGYSDFIKSSMSPDDPHYSGIERICSSGERAADLVRKLLTFSRRLELELKPLNLNMLLKDMARSLKQLTGSDTSLRLTLADDLPEIMADADQLEQIVVNLVTNGVDAMPGGGELAISTEKVVFDADTAAQHKDLTAGTYVLLTVRDSGQGIAAELQNRVFDPFFTTKEVGKGTGLGLAIIYGLVRQHRGGIELASIRQQGTTVSVYFPVREEEAVAAEAEVAVRVEGRVDEKLLQALPGGKEKILVVDDESGARGFVVHALRPLGYTVLEAASGEEALDIIRLWQHPLDLLITDVVMPGMSGGELASIVRQTKPEIRVLFISGYTDKLRVRKEDLMSPTHFLNKPLGVTTLAAAVRTILDQK